MTQTLAIFVSGTPGGVVTTANTTTYYNLAGSPSTNTLQNTYISMREAGSFTNLYVRTTANGIAAVSTFTLRDNAVNATNVVSTISNTAGEYEDTTPHTDTITAGHKYDVVFVPGASSGTVTLTAIRALFNTTTNTATRFAFSAGAGGTAYTAISTTYYFTLNGATGGLGTTESLCKSRQLYAGTMQNMYLVASSNTRTIASTMNSRIDTGGGSANGNMTISLTALTNGLFEDITGGHTDAVVSGNDFNYAFTTSSDSGKTTSLWNIGCSFLNTAGQTYCYCGAANGTSPASTSVKYYLISGNLAATTTETNAQIKTGGSNKFSLMTINLSASSGTGTMNFRKNAGNGNQVVSTTGTGNSTDAVNVDYVVSSDEVNYAYTPGSSSGVTIQYMETWAFGKAYGLTETTSISSTSPHKVARKIPVAISL